MVIDHLTAEDLLAARGLIFFHVLKKDCRPRLLGECLELPCPPHFVEIVRFDFAREILVGAEFEERVAPPRAAWKTLDLAFFVWL
jgi:hypothetical protein